MVNFVKIATQFFAVIVRAIGRLNLDNDVRTIAGGDFINSLNTRAVTDLGGTTNSREIIVGNELVYQLEDIQLQNRIFRIAIKSDIARTYLIDIEDANGNDLYTPTNFFITTAGNIVASLASGIATISADLNTTFQSYNISSTATGTDEGYIELEIFTVNYWNYSVENNGTQSGATDAEISLVQEAVDQSLLGEWHGIGSFDLEGESITWWTTQRDLPSELDISDITQSGLVFQIETATPHGMVDNEKVTILGSAVADGQWIIFVIDATHFNLLGSTYAAGWVSGGVVTVDPNGNGEIGRAVKNEQTGVWTYFRLIRSQVFNFVTKKQIDTFCKKDAIKKRYYWTDDYNVPRVLYDRTLVYQNDVLLNFIDPLNTYDYLALGVESTLILNTGDFIFGFTGQTQAGGNLLSGNTRYAVQLGTETNTWTDPSFLDNPIPAAVSSEGGAGNLFFGNDANTPTPKINNFIVTGNLIGIFTKIRLIAVNYQGTAKTAYIVSETTITGNTMTLTHSGFEQNIQDFDIGLLNALTQVYNTARNIDSLDGYLILSNLTTAPLFDFSSWFETWEHSLGFETMESVGNYNTNQNAGLDVGEYQLSNNVYRITGHQLLETYRFGAIVEYVNGSESPVFWIDDIIISTGNINDTNPLPAVNRRITGLLDYDLTDNSIPPIPRSFYVEFSGFDLDAIVGGVKIRDVVKKIHIFRVDRTVKTVLASGVIIPSVAGTAFSVNPPVAGGQLMAWGQIAPVGDIGEFPFVGGYNEVAGAFPFPVNDPYGSVGAAVPFTVVRSHFAFYFEDGAFGHTQITPQPDFDVIYNFGQPEYDVANNLVVGNGIYPNTPLLHDYLMEVSGYTNQIPTVLNVKNGANIGKGGNALLTGAVPFSKVLVFSYDNVNFPALNYDAAQSLVIYTDTVGGATKKTVFVANDQAIYMAIYKRPLTIDQQYGDKTLSRYGWTGITIEIDSTTVSPFPVGTHIFGGDVFTQRSYLKNRYPIDATPALRGFGHGLAYYPQNVINFQMRSPSTSGTTGLLAFPGFTSVLPTQSWLSNTLLEALQYNEGYTIRNEVTSYIGFDPNAEISNDLRATIAWSAQDLDGSAIDNSRIFLPLNQKYLERRYGVISHHAVGNGELYTWQPRKFERQIFVANDLITTTNGAEVILGDGAVLRRRPIQLSAIGCANKWSIVKGMGAQGGDTFYWLCDYLHSYARFGYDGTTELTLTKGLDSFFRNNLSMVYGKDTPADDQGAHGWWNHAFREAFLCVRAWRDEVEIWEEPFQTSHDFNTPTGERPNDSLIEVNGIFYGTTIFGGANLAGTIFSFDPATNTYTVLHDFLFGAPDSYYPESKLTLAANGNLYGTTRAGGVSNIGSIFEYNIGTATFTKTIDLVAATGSLPHGGMVEFGGMLYGMTTAGGANLGGVIYEYDYLGSVYTDIFDFTSATDGSAPQGALIIVGAMLYGMTFTGGANNSGTIFSYDLTTYTVIHDFILATGSNPMASLLHLNNILWGVTSDDGFNNSGTLFSFDLATNTYTSHHDFESTTGSEPECTLVNIGNNLYGMTKTGGAMNVGVVFEYNITTNTYTVIREFDVTNGERPQIGNSFLVSGTTLYGLTYLGGANNDGVLFSLNLGYDIGTVVSIGTLTGFEQIPAFYESLIDNNLSDPLTSDTWFLVPFTDNRYYNFYTLVYSEIKDGWDGFITPRPRNAFKWNNTYLLPRSVSNTGQVYEANRGTYAVWFDNGTTSQAQDGLVRMVMNWKPDETKQFKAIRVRTEIVPARMNFKTTSGETFMIASDFETREDKHDSAIKGDSTVTIVPSLFGSVANPLGLNDLETSLLWGDYIECELVFQHSVYQRLYSVIVRGELSDRRNNT